MRNQRKQRVQHVIVCVLVCVMLLSMVTPISAQAATYQKGSKGTSVKFLQQNLTFLGFSTGGIDGAFGNNTRKAVMELQKALQFEQTGIVDNGLNQLITDTVSDIQKYLKYKGYYTGIIDGICGNGTKNALKKLQKEKGKAQTGFTDYSILIDIINDVTSGVEMKTLREWVARLNGSYSVTLESEYYEKYGEDYIKLFTEYPELLEADEIFSFLNYSSSYAKILQEEAKEEYTKASVWEGFVNGTEVIVKEILSSFGVGKNLVDQTTYDSIMALVSNMYYKDNAIYETMKKTEEAINQFGDIYSLAEGNSKATLAIEIVKENPDLSLEGVAKVLDTVTENWSGISKELDKGITATEYIVAMIQLYAMTGEFMEELQSVVKQPSVLYSDIEYLKQERERDLEEFLINELAAHGAVELVEELLSLATGGKYEMITEGLDFVSQYTVTATAYEQVHTLLFEAYCENLKDTISIMRADFLNNGNLYITSEWVEKISNYETAYEFYLCAIETYYESVTGLANSYEKTAVEQEIELLQAYDYDSYIKYCIDKMHNLQDNENNGQKTDDIIGKLDCLLKKLGVQNGKQVYFTVNQEACSNSRIAAHGCNNCNMRDIAKASWFTNMFGSLNIDNFPEHDVDASRRDHTGQSCFGFACFVQWYLYAEDSNDKVTAERIASVKFNKANMEKYVQPGDVVRVNGHSVVVYSLEKDGLMVIDCNWNSGGQLNCLVQKHLLSYSNTNYAGYTAYVNRVTKCIKGNNKVEPIATPALTPEPIVSGWVKASECPEGATVVDTKWTYTYTERTESTSATKDGWICDGERKEVVDSGTFDYATFPDTFNTSHAVYTSMFTSKNAIPVADGVTREFISDSPSGYVYWHYAYPMSGGGDAGNRIVGYYYNQNLKYVGSWCYATEFCAFKSSKNYTTTANNKEGGGTVYKITDSEYMKYNVAKGSYWWYRFEYNTCTYQDVKTVYQYYRTTSKESASEVKEGNGISNVVKWVKYK